MEEKKQENGFPGTEAGDKATHSATEGAAEGDAQGTPAVPEAPPVEAPPPEEPKEASEPEVASEPEDPPGGEAAQAVAEDTSNKKWYIVQTYSGYEQKVKLSLEKQLQTLRTSKKERQRAVADYFGEILIPMENVVELVKGQRRTTSRKFFPGYILVQMDNNDESRHLVRETPKVSGFLGGGKEPTAISDVELNRIQKQQTEGAERPRPKVLFERGENIRVINGPFANFTGVVEDVKPEKGKVKVLVTIFGRATPVELSFVEVEKS